MKRSPPASPEPRLITYRNERSLDVGRPDNVDGDIAASSSETTTAEHGESVKKLLKEILNALGLIATRICDPLGDARADGREKLSSGDEDEKEDEMRNDWMLAAAVIDRICAIVIIVIYVVGTVSLAIPIIMHY